MCTLCDQVSAQRLGIANPNDRFASYGLSIAPAELLDNGSVGLTRRATSTDGVLSYYLHAPGGAVTVSGGGFGEQEIQSLAIPRSDQDYFNAMVRRLDSIIDLDFRQVDHPSSADVDLYYDTNIDLGFSGTILGLAISSDIDAWELYLNYPKLEDDNYRRYALIHEFGHSLGLEHPFESRDGDVFNGNSDPWSSAYPEDTVMAYRSPISGFWPDFFSDNDISALIEVWGAEARLFDNDSDIIIGAAYRDIFMGAGGDDELRGRSGADHIEGGLGDDQVMGGDGADYLFGGAGEDAVFGGYGRDTITGGSGADRIRGGFGGDLFVWSSGQDVIEDFRLLDNDRFAMHSGMSYKLHQQGADLKLITTMGVTTFLGVDLDGFLATDRLMML